MGKATQKLQINYVKESTEGREYAKKMYEEKSRKREKCKEEGKEAV